MNYACAVKRTVEDSSEVKWGRTISDNGDEGHVRWTEIFQEMLDNGTVFHRSNCIMHITSKTRASIHDINLVRPLLLQ